MKEHSKAGGKPAICHQLPLEQPYTLLCKNFTVHVNESVYSTGIMVCWTLNFVKWNILVGFNFAIHDRFSFSPEEEEF